MEPSVISESARRGGRVGEEGSENSSGPRPQGGYLFPFLDLRSQFAGIQNEVLSAIQEVMESQQFILGRKVEEFENELARRVGSRFAVGCASGSDALLLSLMAMEIGPSDEVITTPFTFVATAGSIARLKARPVFVDIDPDTFNIDPKRIPAAITAQTRAILPVHLFGLAAEMDSILEIAGSHPLPVIEDAAQAIDARFKGAPVGSLGRLGCFSFFPSKNLGGAGDGGLVTTNDPILADRVRVLGAHGSRKKYDYERIGINSRLDALQAAILRVKLAHLSAWTAARRRVAERYRTLFAELRLLDCVKLPSAPAGRVHVYHQFVVRCPLRDRLREFLTSRGIPTEVYYPSPLHLQPAFADLGYKPGEFPRAEAASREALALPIYPELPESHQVSVVRAIREFYGGQR
jgi:dTDP-4-amino-4,6-dideoxygalactose transaminase